MLSGIGDHGFLQAMGIETLVDLPDVGRHLQDQPIMENYWTVSSNQTLDNVSRDPAVFNADLALWEKTEQACLWLHQPIQLDSSEYPKTIQFFRTSQIHPQVCRTSDQRLSLFHKYLSGPNTPHIELLPGVSHTVLFLPLPYLIFNLYIGQF